MFEKRIWILFSFLAVISIVFAGRLFFLQIIKGKFYRALAQGQYESLKEVPGTRGEIMFSNGKKLATNVKEYFLSFNPQKISSDVTLVQSLEKILSLNFQDIKGKTNIKIKLLDQQVDDLKKLHSSLLNINQEIVRSYPQKGLAAHVVGFVGGNHQGQYGLEEKYESILRGKPGLFKWEHSPFGFLVSDSKAVSQPQAGSNLVLSLDYNIQFESEKLLREAKEKWDIQSGTIIVMNPHTGDILAMANFPSFDPNHYEQKQLSDFQNTAIQKLFEPGSIFKAITMAAGLNEGKINPSTTYEDKGYVNVGGPRIYNYDHEVYGQKNMTEVLEKSINTGAIFVEQQLGSKLFWKYIQRFGFTQPTHIDLAGETYSRNTRLQHGYPRDYATASFGQGIATTPIQVVQACSAIANDGIMVQPHIVQKIISPQKQIIPITPTTQKVITAKTASRLTTMLVQVVEKGYGKPAKIKGYQIAGKTGTAEVLLPGEKQYDKDQTIQSFIGFAPALNPRFLALVKLDNPDARNAYYSAAPLFGELTQFILNYYQIPPSLNR